MAIRVQAGVRYAGQHWRPSPCWHLPIFLVIALAREELVTGPVFFRQERIGKHGRPFRIIKFRSMVANAETARPSAEQYRRPTDHPDRSVDASHSAWMSSPSSGT
jgi:lipopolysaccharide/colanic/teichoic acid biosynthesis glycosyltransferase